MMQYRHFYLFIWQPFQTYCCPNSFFITGCFAKTYLECAMGWHRKSCCDNCPQKYGMENDDIFLMLAVKRIHIKRNFQLSSERQQFIYLVIKKYLESRVFKQCAVHLLTASLNLNLIKPQRYTPSVCPKGTWFTKEQICNVKQSCNK